MSLVDAVRNVGREVVGRADNAGDRFVGGLVQARSTLSGSGRVAGSVISNTLGTGRDAVIGTMRFQASVTRFGLERSLNISQRAGAATLNIAQRGLNRVTHPGNPNPPAAQGLLFSESKGASHLAYDANQGEIYQFPDGKRWQVADVQDDQRTGFRAIALRPLDPSDSRIIVAFAGTRDGKDWRNNIQQGLGLPSRQYTQAVEFANRWKAQEGNNVHLTGHSLGGGLASYASIRTNLRATAINSAPLALNRFGLNPFEIARDARRITQYYVPGEALTVFADGNPLNVRPGRSIAVQGRGSIFDPRSLGSNHGLENTAPGIGLPVRIR